VAFSTLQNLVRVLTATTGTGTLTLGATVTGFIGVPAALDGKYVTYEIAEPGSAPTAREVGRGLYTLSGATLTRATIFASTNGGSAINLTSGAAYVSLTLCDDDIENLWPISITCQAGTTSVDPLTFTSGTNLSAAANGACEYNGTALMFTPCASSRGAVPAVQFAALTADYTLTSTTAAQKIFNVPSAGSLTVAASTRYFFKALLYITGFSSASGNAKIDLIGTGNATFSSTLWTAFGLDGATPTTAAAPVGVLITATGSGASIMTASTATNLYVMCDGQFRVNAGGTLVPAISLVTAIAAVVKADSYFTCWPVSTGATTTLGAWT
jgi:hypothetical protein